MTSSLTPAIGPASNWSAVAQLSRRLGRLGFVLTALAAGSLFALAVWRGYDAPGRAFAGTARALSTPYEIAVDGVPSPQPASRAESADGWPLVKVKVARAPPPPRPVPAPPQRRNEPDMATAELAWLLADTPHEPVEGWPALAVVAATQSLGLTLLRQGAHQAAFAWPGEDLVTVLPITTPPQPLPIGRPVTVAAVNVPIEVPVPARVIAAEGLPHVVPTLFRSPVTPVSATPLATNAGAPAAADQASAATAQVASPAAVLAPAGNPAAAPAPVAKPQRAFRPLPSKPLVKAVPAKLPAPAKAKPVAAAAVAVKPAKRTKPVIRKARVEKPGIPAWVKQFP